ncbi:hypothetical protein ACI3EY_08065 [Ornithinimicrobium sp. LYQ92]|uniref:hypothetical protein n=1 Tax=Serinicoccus sp. LYQ92 TaxID=3378798 RepID=UPI003851E369
MPKTQNGIQYPGPSDTHPSAAWWQTLATSIDYALRSGDEAVKAQLAALGVVVDDLGVHIEQDYLLKAEAQEFGIAGPPNVLGIGTVTPGETADAEIRGESPSQLLDLTLPRGLRGVPGPGGAIGLVETEDEGMFVESEQFAWRWDNTVGKRLLVREGADERMVWGDTGWRDMSATLIAENGWTGVSTFQIRRVGDQVFFNLWGLTRDSNASGTVGVANLMPDGFRPPISVYGLIPTSVYTRFYINVAGAFVLISPPTLSFCTVSYVTNQSWPTTLPGTPA